MTSTYLGYRLYANDLVGSLQRVAAEPGNARALAYYQANIGKVTSVDQFLGDYRLFSTAMTAYGLQDIGDAKGLMKKVLESDLSDPKSFANQLSDTRYRSFAAAFQFSTKGALADTTAVETSTQEADTTARYAKTSTATAAAQKAATAYYMAHIEEATSVAALENDSKLQAYVLSAYGLDAKTSETTLTKGLESDLSDPKSFANTSGSAGLEALAADFNFNAEGEATNQRLIQSADALTATTTAYETAAGTTTAAQAAATTETTYYTATIPTLTSLDGLLGNKRLVAYLETAYGIPTSTTTSQLKSVLTSDLSKSGSVANTVGSADRTLAAAFNVATSGTIARTPVQAAQSRSAIIATTDAYLEQSMETEAGNQSEGVRLALYFREKAPTITSAYSILADKALTEVAQTMLGLSASSSNADIDSQARAITKRLNLADLKNPQKLDRLIARFAALYDLQNSSSSGSSSTSSSNLTVASLF